MDKPMHPISARGMDHPVDIAHDPKGRSGITFSVVNRSIILCLVKDGEGLSIVMSEQVIDSVGHLFAEAVEKLNRLMTDDLAATGTVQ